MQPSWHNVLGSSGILGACGRVGMKHLVLSRAWTYNSIGAAYQIRYGRGNSLLEFLPLINIKPSWQAIVTDRSGQSRLAARSDIAADHVLSVLALPQDEFELVPDPLTGDLSICRQSASYSSRDCLLFAGCPQWL